MSTVARLAMIAAKLGAIVLLLGVLANGYWYFTRPPTDTTVAAIAPPAKAVQKVKRVKTPTKEVQTYSPEAKARLKLPPAVLASDSKYVIGAATVSPSERSVTVTSVLDTATGETTTYTKSEPLPWFALEPQGGLRVDFGYKMQRGTPTPTPVGRLSVTHNFVQVKGFRAGVSASLDTDGVLFAGVGVEYRW